jgi:hypothetical protein
MKRKGLMTKMIIALAIIATTSLIAIATNDSFQSTINNGYRSSIVTSFYATPNPFEDFTVITLVFDRHETGSLIIEDSKGGLVKELYRGLFSGEMDFIWDATDEKENRVENGAYYCRLNTGNQYTSRTIILILK